MLNGQRTDYYRGAGGHIALMHQFKGGTRGQMYWYHYNNKGDVVGLNKQNGNSHHNYRYDPYGAVLPENGNFTDPHNHYTLTGKEFDENTGLVWFGSRHYEPETGVWMGQDSYRGGILAPMSLHRFMYVDNNPLIYYDFYGFWKLITRDGYLIAVAERGDYLSDLSYSLTGVGDDYTKIVDATNSYVQNNKSQDDIVEVHDPDKIAIGQEFIILGLNNELTFMNSKLKMQHQIDSGAYCYLSMTPGCDNCNQCDNNCWATSLYLSGLKGNDDYVDSSEATKILTKNAKKN
jgi:RHS repeat-associated protein